MNISFHNPKCPHCDNYLVNWKDKIVDDVRGTEETYVCESCGMDFIATTQIIYSFVNKDRGEG